MISYEEKFNVTLSKQDSMNINQILAIIPVGINALIYILKVGFGTIPFFEGARLHLAVL